MSYVLWLMWLSWWSVVPCTERLQVWFLVRAHTHVASSIPSQGAHKKATNRCLSLSLSLSLFLSLSFPLFLKAIKKMSLGEDKKKRMKKNEWCRSNAAVIIFLFLATIRYSKIQILHRGLRYECTRMHTHNWNRSFGKQSNPFKLQCTLINYHYKY